MKTSNMGMDSLEKHRTSCPIYKPCNTRESTHCHILEITTSSSRWKCPPSDWPWPCNGSLRDSLEYTGGGVATGSICPGALWKFTSFSSNLN